MWLHHRACSSSLRPTRATMRNPAPRPGPILSTNMNSKRRIRKELSRRFLQRAIAAPESRRVFCLSSGQDRWPAGVRIDGGGGTASEAHFLIGLCSSDRLPEPRSFVYVPKAANQLRGARTARPTCSSSSWPARRNWLAETKRRDSLLALHRDQRRASGPRIAGRVTGRAARNRGAARR